MIVGNINLPSTCIPLHEHPKFRMALEWIEQHAATAEDGVYELDGKACFVNVQSYETLDRSNARFEAHRRYLDIQYMIRGEEAIDWIGLHDVAPESEFCTKNDVGLFVPKASGQAFSSIHMQPGMFAVFYPEDVHRPKVMVSEPAAIKKLVVKIDLDWLGDV